MTDRALIVDSVTGAIRRVLTMPATMLALNVHAGETAFQITNDDGLHIDDANLLIDETGEWAVRDGAPVGVTVPGVQFELVAP